MLRLLALTALLGVTIAAPLDADAGKKAKAKPKKTFRIDKATPITTGLTYTITDQITLDGTLTSTSMGTMPIKLDDHGSCVVEVLEASDDRVDRLHVVYGTVEQVFDVMGQHQAQPQPQSGLTYTIEAGANGPVVTGSDGKPAAADQAKEVIEDHGRMLRRTPMRWIVGRTWKKGKKVKLGEDEFADMFSDEKIKRVDGFTIAFAKVDGDVARFTWSATFVMQEDGGDVSFDVTGTFDLDKKRALIREVEMQGTMDANIKQGSSDSMSMSGTLVGHLTYAYQ